MATLLLRLAGPMQAWGTSSKIDTRNTDAYPSKSGVIGMIAAALGYSRDEPIDNLASMKFGVRIDQQGTVMRDYHTAHHPEKDKLAYITNRFYLEDAIFLVGIEGDNSTLSEIDHAIRNPYYPLFLGRRSCVVTGKVSLGIRDKSLNDALRDEPWLASEWYSRRKDSNVQLEIITDSDDEAGYLIRDNPQSFSFSRRKHGFRKASMSTTCIDNPKSCKVIEKSTAHDAFENLGGV